MNTVWLLAAETTAAGSRGLIQDWLAAPQVRILLAAAVLAVIGIWWMLPATRRRSWRHAGSVLCVVAAMLFASLLPHIGNTAMTIVFWMLAGVTIGSAVATITSKSPVYCAIWFAMTLLGTGGLFLINGAQFLGVATVAVYAGAIVVTFLFVLMLAQPEGHTFYDRVGWGTLPSLLGATAGILFVVLMTLTILNIGVPDGPAPESSLAAVKAGLERDVLADQHVARLGSQLFSTHLVSVQAAGTLLLAALVGAVAIASAGKPRSRFPLAAGQAVRTANFPHGSADPSKVASDGGRRHE